MIPLSSSVASAVGAVSVGADGGKKGERVIIGSAPCSTEETPTSKDATKVNLGRRFDTSTGPVKQRGGSRQGTGRAGEAGFDHVCAALSQDREMFAFEGTRERRLWIFPAPSH